MYDCTTIRPEMNFHHIWWKEKSYPRKAEKEFRNSKAFVIPVLRTVHQRLHGEVKPPQRPSKGEMRDLMDLTVDLPLEDNISLQGLYVAQNYFRDLALLDNEQGDRAELICLNLDKQLGFLAVERELVMA